MNVRDVSVNEAVALCKKEESHFFDFKAAAVLPRSIEKVAVAFGNADGGEIIVGIDDPKTSSVEADRWHGFKSLEDMNSLLQSLFNLSPSLEMKYELLKSPIRPGYVLRITIEKGSSVYKTSDNTVYVRQGAQSLPLKDPEKISALGFAKGSSSYEDMILSESQQKPWLKPLRCATY